MADSLLVSLDIESHNIFNNNEINGYVFRNSQKVLQELAKNLEGENNNEILEKLLNLKQGSLIHQIYFLSFALEVSKNKKYVEELIRIIMSDQVGLDVKYFLYMQIRVFHANNANVIEEIRMIELYATIYKQFEELFMKQLNVNLENDYCNNHVVIFTNQFLGTQHNPTKNILDLAHALNEENDAKIYIINIADFPRKLVIPYYKPFISNFINEYSKGDTFINLGYKEKYFKYYQPLEIMPNITDIQKILEFVKSCAPKHIIAYGSNFVANLFKDVTSLHTIPTNISSTDIPISIGGSKVVNQIISEEELVRLNLDRNDILEICETDSDLYWDEMAKLILK